MEHCDSDYYADDAMVHYTGKTKTDVEARLQNDGNNANFWGRQTEMNVHYDKTTCMLIATRHRTQTLQQMSIHIDGNKIKSVTKQKAFRSTHRRKSTLDRSYRLIVFNNIIQDLTP